MLTLFVADFTKTRYIHQHLIMFSLTLIKNSTRSLRRHVTGLKCEIYIVLILNTKMFWLLAMMSYISAKLLRALKPVKRCFHWSACSRTFLLMVNISALSCVRQSALPKAMLTLCTHAKALEPCRKLCGNKQLNVVVC